MNINVTGNVLNSGNVQNLYWSFHKHVAYENFALLISVLKHNLQIKQKNVLLKYNVQKRTYFQISCQVFL